MSLQSRITALAQAVGADIKALQGGTLFGVGPPDARASIVGSTVVVGFSTVAPFALSAGDTVIVGYKTEGSATAAVCTDSLGSTYTNVVGLTGVANNTRLFSTVLGSDAPALTVQITTPGNDFDMLAVLAVKGLTGTVLTTASLFEPDEAALNLLSMNVTAPRSFQVLLWAGYRNMSTVSMQPPFAVQAQDNGAGALGIGTAMRVSPGDTTAITVTTAGFPDNQALLMAAFQLASAAVEAAEGTVYYDMATEPCRSYLMYQGAWRVIGF